MRSLLLALLIAVPIAAAEPTPAQVEHFEKKIRPLLIDSCYSCHADNKGKEPKGGLRVDSREALITGGDNGAAMAPGSPEKSKLIEAVKYANADLQMPPKGKLTAVQIADLEQWVKDGAAWPGPAATGEKKAVFDLAKRKAEHWAWQTVKAPAVPTVKNASWPKTFADNFILEKLEAKGLTPAPDADDGTWLRRVTFAITGLPPTPEELAAFLKEPSQREKVVDRLLASPAYGERWGRHWLDLVRYAESMGHEFDNDIPNVWHYRDYVIRAFNEDVPYDRFVQEHLAGDRIKPRMNGNTNEALIGTAFWRLGEEVHSPVDIRQDSADRFDNRIDVMSKTFLALTVSCARCHDHKFDAISTKDYYALFGLLQGSSDTPVNFESDANRLIAKRREAAFKTIFKWFGASGLNIPDRVASPETILNVESLWKQESFEGMLPYTMFLARAGSFTTRSSKNDLSLHQEERTAFVLDRYWQRLAPAAGFHAEFGKLGGLNRADYTIRTPSFKLEHDNLYYLVRGGGMAYASIGNHTAINGPLQGAIVERFKDQAEYRWVKHSLKDYKGMRFHVELTADPKTEFALAMIVQGDETPPLPPAPKLSTVTDDKRKLFLDALQTHLAAIKEPPLWGLQIVPGFVDNAPVNEQVFIRGNPRTLGEVVPHRGLEALDGPEGIKHERGSGRYEWANRMTDPKRNPFLARVMVNRVWHHLFGRGIVASVDNFGVLGERPSHPELLDHLATEFVNGGFKLKPLIKRLVLSRFFAMSSTPREATSPEMANDPANVLLHTFRIKRLEGEAIRDSILFASGRLDRTLGGPPVPVHLTPFMDGRGKPKVSGPVDGNGRRSVYLAVRRNFPSPFLQGFDTPIPFSTVGRRQVSNVPAQSLILMNDPFVHSQAIVWGKRLAAEKGRVDERITTMFRIAFARPPSESELAACREIVAKNDAESWTALAHAVFNVKEFIYVR
ncbi:PSD1 and planctomycete cytochrome C domain-containing protein [soil metagenome]